MLPLAVVNLPIIFGDLVCVGSLRGFFLVGFSARSFVRLADVGFVPDGLCASTCYICYLSHNSMTYLV